MRMHQTVSGKPKNESKSSHTGEVLEVRYLEVCLDIPSKLQDIFTYFSPYTTKEKSIALNRPPYILHIAFTTFATTAPTHL